MEFIRKIRHPNRDFAVPIVVAKIPIVVAAQVQMEEIVFYSVHNPAPSTSNTTSAGTLQLDNRRLVGCRLLARQDLIARDISDLLEKPKSKSFWHKTK